MEILFCDNCSGVLRAEDEFCPHCGEKVRTNEKEITLVVPKGITKLTVRFDENVTKAEFDNKIKNISLDNVMIPEQCYLEGMKYAVECGTISISMLQRRLAIGYPKAGQIIEWMENNGFISSFSGSCARKVYLTKEQLEKLVDQYGSH